MSSLQRCDKANILGKGIFLSFHTSVAYFLHFFYFLATFGSLLIDIHLYDSQSDKKGYKSSLGFLVHNDRVIA